MRSGGNNFNYFPKNKLTKLTDFVQFMRMLMFCLEDWGPPRPWLRHCARTCRPTSILKFVSLGYW